MYMITFRILPFFVKGTGIIEAILLTHLSTLQTLPRNASTDQIMIWESITMWQSLHTSERDMYFVFLKKKKKSLKKGFFSECSSKVTLRK